MPFAPLARIFFMRRVRSLSAAFLAVVVVVVASCTDRPLPTQSAMRTIAKSANGVAGVCTTIPALKTLATTVFGSNNQYLHDALDNISDIGEYVAENHISDAQKKAKTLIAWIQLRALTLATPSQLQNLIDSINCYVGLSTDTYLVLPNPTTTTNIVTTTGTAGLQLPPASITTPTLLTVTTLAPTTTGVLDTKLDQYPNYVVVSQTGGTIDPLHPITVAVCPTGVTDPIVRGRLRLGHQKAAGPAGFEITPHADASFLDCSGIASANSSLPGWVNSLAALILPKPLYARMRDVGGVGGSASEFSPFGPVDTELGITGGVGGSASEFLRAPVTFDTTTTPKKSTTPTDPKARTLRSAPSSGTSGAPNAGKVPVTSGASGTTTVGTMTNLVDCSQGVVSTAVVAECRPVVRITTAQGHSLTNVRISWTVTAGGGTIAREDTVGGSLVCNATVGSSFDAVTNTSGKSHACWTLGAVAGTNTVTATASAGGDAPTGVTFVATGTSWTTTAAKAVATLTLSGLNQTYNGDAKSVTVTTTPVLLSTVTVTYGGSTTAPKTAGSYAVDATLDNPSYQGTASGTLVIAQASQLPLSITSPAPGASFGGTVQLSTDGGSGTGALTFDATGSTACTVTTGGLVSITHGTGTCSITASKAADTNYGSVSSSAFTLTVSKKNTTITLSNLGYTYDTTPKSATATTDPAGLAGLALTYDGSTTAPTNAGAYALIASLENSDYTAPSVTGTLAIAKADQGALSVTGTNTIAFTGSTVALGTTGGSGTGTVTYSAGASTACTVTLAGIVTATTGTGSCVPTATKALDGNYNETTSAPYTITVTRASATITLSNMTQTYVGTAKSATATTSPTGLITVAIKYNGSTTAPTAAGSYAVVASLTNADYLAPDATGTFVISKATQSVLHVTGSTGSATYGDTPAQLTTSGGSGTGAVTFSASGTACTVSTDGLLTITTGTGSCAITATKAGDGNYSDLSSSAFPITINKATASLSITNNSYSYDGSAKNVTVTPTPAAATGISVTYDGGAAPSAAGTYAVVASLTNANYAAPNATGSLTIAKANQATLLVNAPASATFNSGTVQLTTSGGNGGGAVTYDASTTPLVCSVNATSGVLTILVGTGSCVVSAAKAGDTNYNAATSATASITLNKGSQSITFGPLGGKTYGDAAFTVTATVSSSLAVSFAAGVTDKCTVSGNTVTITGAGNCTITASQAGNGNFAAAAPVPQSFTTAPKAAAATAGSGSMTFGSAVPSLPCVVSGLLVSDAVTCATTVPAITVGTLTTTASLNASAAAANYQWTLNTGTLTVTSPYYTQYNCFASPLTSTSTAATSKAVERGSTVPLKCKLLDGSGRPVSTAKGSVTVQDKGTTGTTNGAIVFQATNVFGYTTSDDVDEGSSYYRYNLVTAPNNAYAKGHYYLVTATWSDGSTTKGWIFVK